MDDMIELVVKISKFEYEICKQALKDPRSRPITECEFAIAVGTPLEDVKAEIREQQKEYQEWGWAYDDVLEILDNIGKAESEDT